MSAELKKVVITPERIGAEFKQGDLLSSRFISLCFALILLLPGIALGQQKAEGIYEEYAKKASEQSQGDLLIGIWSGSSCGKRYIVAVVRGRESANGLQVILINGKEVGGGQKDGDLLFYVSPLVIRGVYEGTIQYRGKRFYKWFPMWFPTRVIMTGDDAFTTDDSVTVETWAPRALLSSGGNREQNKSLMEMRAAPALASCSCSQHLF